MDLQRQMATNISGFKQLAQSQETDISALTLLATMSLEFGSAVGHRSIGEQQKIEYAAVYVANKVRPGMVPIVNSFKTLDDVMEWVGANYNNPDEKFSRTAKAIEAAMDSLSDALGMEVPNVEDTVVVPLKLPKR